MILVKIPWSANLLIDRSHLPMLLAAKVVDSDGYPLVVRLRKDQSLEFQTINAEAVLPALEEPPAAPVLAPVEPAPPTGNESAIIDDDLPF